MVPFAEVFELLVSAYIVPSGSCRMVDMDLEELAYYRLFDGTQWKRQGE